MKQDSFENFGRYRNLILDKLNNFIENYQNSTDEIKKLIHYQSVINVSNEIIRHNNSEANKLKDLIIDYLDISKEFDFSQEELNNPEYINKKRKVSLDLYEKHIFPVGQYLVHNAGFGSNSFIPYTVIGIIIDALIYFLVTKELIPMFIIIFTIIGKIRSYHKRKQGKVFSVFK